MESSIAEFLERQLACELLPTVVSSNCKEFVGLGMKKARTHPKKWEPKAWIATWPEQPYVFIPSQPFGYDQV